MKKKYGNWKRILGWVMLGVPVALIFTVMIIAMVQEYGWVVTLAVYGIAGLISASILVGAHFIAGS